MNWLAGALVFLLATAASAQAPRAVPCAGLPLQATAAPVGPPVVQTRDVTDWTPPPCLGWAGPRPRLLVAVSGRIHGAADPAELLSRLGAVSRLRGMRYWSVTDKAWLTLITEAFATEDAAGLKRRDDIGADEMVPGASLYASQRDGRSSEAVVYRMRVLAREPEHVVVTVANATSVHAALMTAFAPGELQITYFLDRLGTEDWSYFTLSGITTGPFTSGHTPSWINRAVASYRYLAGIQTDLEPPAAR